MSISELATAIVKAKSEEEVEEEAKEEVIKKEGDGKEVILSGNLAEAEPILVVNSEDETPVEPKVVEEQVELSFVGGQGVDSSSNFEMLPKFMEVWDPEPIPKKTKGSCSCCFY